MIYENLLAIKLATAKRHNYLEKLTNIFNKILSRTKKIRPTFHQIQVTV